MHAPFGPPACAHFICRGGMRAFPLSVLQEGGAGSTLYSRASYFGVPWLATPQIPADEVARWYDVPSIAVRNSIWHRDCDDFSFRGAPPLHPTPQAHLTNSSRLTTPHLTLPHSTASPLETPRRTVPRYVVCRHT